MPLSFLIFTGFPISNNNQPASIIDQYQLKLKKISIPDYQIKLYQTDHLDPILDKITVEQFNRDERMPYFLTTWESGYYLAHYFAENNNQLLIKNKTILELGSGTGIGGLFLGLMGARIIFTDYESESLALCRENACLNQLKHFQTRLLDWRSFSGLDQSIDIAVGADLLYEKKQIKPLYQTIKILLKKGTTVYLADPGREHIKPFLALLKKDDSHIHLLKEYVNKKSTLRNIKIYRLRMQDLKA